MQSVTRVFTYKTKEKKVTGNETDEEQNTQKGSEKCDYQNKDCYQKKGARPDDWNEEALGIKIVLAREALPVLS